MRTNTPENSKNDAAGNSKGTSGTAMSDTKPKTNGFYETTIVFKDERCRQYESPTKPVLTNGMLVIEGPTNYHMHEARPAEVAHNTSEIKRYEIHHIRSFMSDPA